MQQRGNKLMEIEMMHPVARQLAEYYNREDFIIEADKAEPPLVYAQTKGKEFDYEPKTWLRLAVYTKFEKFGVTSNLNSVSEEYDQQLAYDKLTNFTNIKPIAE